MRWAGTSAADAAALVDAPADSAGEGTASSSTPPKTAVLMMNMGGPSTPDETGPFLQRLFQDRDIIELPGGPFVQKYLGEFIAKRRTPDVQAQYELIGGSPIRKWTELQGKEMCKILDVTNPDSAPHKAYTAFRYAHPLTDEALDDMEADGVKRVVAFSQFPQWSCTTSGSSLNELWKTIKGEQCHHTLPRHTANPLPSVGTPSSLPFLMEPDTM